jgi:transcription antitermination protein NusB
MGARTKARKRALDVLFESELRGLPLDATLAAQQAVDAERPLNDYTVRLVQGVAERRSDIDDTIERYATGWSLARMPAVDRNLLRIGVYELRYVDEVPAAVALSEAVALARELSTEESPAFVNGLLASIAAEAALPEGS